MTTWDLQEKSGEETGGGWRYEDPNLTYNAATDPDSGDIVYYNGIGLTVTWVNQTKSS